MRELREPNTPFFVLMYKETLLAANDLPSTLPSVVFDLLQEYDDVFPKEVPPCFPPKQGSEHKIDLVPGAPLPKVPHIESAKRGELSDSTKYEGEVIVTAPKLGYHFLCCYSLLALIFKFSPEFAG